MPCIDNNGGLEILLKLGDLRIPRMSGPKLDADGVSCLSLNDVPRVASLTVSSTAPPPPVDDRGWYPIATYWNADELGNALGANQPYWVERCHDDIEVINSVVLPPPSGGWFSMDVLCRSVSGTTSVTHNGSVCRVRSCDADCIVQPYRTFALPMLRVKPPKRIGFRANSV